jgi:hypothetical protein
VTSTLALARRPLRHALLFPALAALCGCAQLPQYTSTSSWPEKDVLAISVFVGGDLDPSAYRAIALREAESRLREPSPAALPVYEVRCEFFCRPRPSDRPRRLAVVHLYPDGDHDGLHGDGPMARARTRTVVY